MKAKLNGNQLIIKAENEEEREWIVRASRHTFMRNLGASVGAPPNWLELDCANGFHAYELTSLLQSVSKKLAVINEAFLGTNQQGE